MSDLETAAAVAASRALVACSMYAGADDASTAAWSQWFGDVTTAGADPGRLEATVSAHGRRLAWSAWSLRPSFVEGVGAMLERHATSAEELDRLFDVAARARGRWGAWAAQLADGFEGGWAVRGEIDLSFARGVLDGARDLAILEAFADHFDLDAVTEIARAVAAGAPSWDVALSLGDAPRGEAWAEILRLLELAPPPPAERRFLDERSACRAELVVRLLPRGVAAVGVRVATAAGRDGLAALAAGRIAEDHDRSLAAVEAALAVDGPTSVTFTRGSGGADLVLGYARRGEV